MNPDTLATINSFLPLSEQPKFSYATKINCPPTIKSGRIKRLITNTNLDSKECLLRKYQNYSGFQMHGFNVMGSIEYDKQSKFIWETYRRIKGHYSDEYTMRQFITEMDTCEMMKLNLLYATCKLQPCQKDLVVVPNTAINMDYKDYTVWGVFIKEEDAPAKFTAYLKIGHRTKCITIYSESTKSYYKANSPPGYIRLFPEYINKKTPLFGHLSQWSIVNIEIHCDSNKTVPMILRGGYSQEDEDTLKLVKKSYDILKADLNDRILIQFKVVPVDIYQRCITERTVLNINDPQGTCCGIGLLCKNLNKITNIEIRLDDKRLYKITPRELDYMWKYTNRNHFCSENFGAYYLPLNTSMSSLADIIGVLKSPNLDSLITLQLIINGEEVDDNYTIYLFEYTETKYYQGVLS